MFTRPVTHKGIRLFYRTQPKFNNLKFDPYSVTNVEIMIHLWRWFKTLDHETTMWPKKDLHRVVFDGNPLYTVETIGKVISAVAQYRTHFQQNARKSNNYTNTMFWRWTCPTDIIYGLEFFMVTTWLGDWIRFNDEWVNQEVIEEELEILEGMSPSEHRQFLEELSSPEFIRFRSAHQEDDGQIMVTDQKTGKQVPI